MVDRTKYYILFILCLACILQVQGQEKTKFPTESPAIEEQLENITQANDDEIPEDDSYLQNLEHFLKEPLNLNYADQGLLEELHILSPIQISNLLSYRKLMGDFLSIYELQAIPGWDIPTIEKLRPYITVSTHVELFGSVGSRLRNGDHTLMVRVSQLLEKQEGYLRKPSDGKSYYPGSPQKILVRYKYKFKNLLQYGITAEKDAGEQFFKGGQKQGFDFYSAHFFLRDLGVVKALAIGDFSVNMGQGLVQWQSLSFGKGSDVMSIKRQADILRPYNSAGEIEFNRGIGITLGKNNWEGTLFTSYRRVDANFNVDTLNFEDYVSSLQLSGLHRTKSELANKGTQGQFTIGGNLNYATSRFNIGVNAVHYDFEHTISKKDVMYNKYALSGKKAGNYSVDYSFTYKNMHFFGEAAVDEKMDKAFINGLAISAASRVDVSFLYRNISKGYQTLYSDAFTEATNPNNESGFFTGISLTPVDAIRIDAYADFFHSPWLRYRTDAPSYGNEYMVQMTYRPKREVRTYIRYRVTNKAINYNPGDHVMNPVVNRPKQNLRAQFDYKFTSAFTFRSRVDMLWFDKRGKEPENGFLTYADILYKPLLSSLSGNIRLSYFETDSYNSRMYAFENDVLYSYSIPVFFGKGYRYYVNVKYSLTRDFSLYMRLAQTIYPDQTEIGSSLSKIHGNKKSELKLQAMYRF